MKAFVWCALFSVLGSVIAEPPTGGYLPPRTGFGGAGGFGSDRRGLGGHAGGGSGFGGGFQSGGGSGFGGGYGGAGDGPSEPANYEFSYEVKDAASGNNFGHSEARKGEVAQGKYFVLLPDGRTLIVDYTADESGYHPIIKYEGEAKADAGAGGYSGGAGGYSGGAGGYSGGAGYSGGFGAGNQGGGFGGFQRGGAGSGSFDSASGYKY